MKRVIYLLLVLVFLTQACSLPTPTPPAQPTRKSPYEKASQTVEVKPAPATPEPTQDAAPPPAQDDAPPKIGGDVDVSLLVETDTDILGMYKDDAKVYNEIIAAGARIVNLEPMNTFYVVWVPKGYENMETRRVMVVAHGHTGSSYFQMAQELEFGRQYGYAIVAIQWWTGEGEKMYSGEQFYEFMDTALRYMAYKYNAQLDKCAYRGWSMGSGISYEVAYLDRINGTNYLRLTISHDGGMMPDPSKMSVGREFVTNLYNGVYGQDALEGKHFYLYAGEEPQAGYMRNTAEVIPNFGGIVERYVEDIGAGHGGFFEHPQYHHEAAELFLQLAP